nr:AraC family transcriptional regulator [Anaerostipes caccae]
MTAPFTISIIAFHPEEISDSAFSFFTPSAQFNLPAAEIRGHDRMHQHNCFEFAYVLQGNMYQLVEGKRYIYTPGSCCLMNRNTLHTEELATEFVCIFFSISFEFVEKLISNESSMLFPVEQERFDNLIFHFLEYNLEKDHPDSKDFLDFVPRITETDQKVMVHDIFEKMLTTILSPYYGATYRLQNLFFQLIDILCNPRYYNAVHVTTKISMESLLFSRIDQILDEHHGRISNKRLVQFLNYNGSYLGKIVKKHTGQSLFDYSMNFTMEHAAKLLRDTEKSVSEIASELKFSNRTHFYRIFENHYQMTPKEYRKEYGKAVT